MRFGKTRGVGIGESFYIRDRDRKGIKLFDWCVFCVLLLFVFNEIMELDVSCVCGFLLIGLFVFLVIVGCRGSCNDKRRFGERDVAFVMLDLMLNLIDCWLELIDCCGIVDFWVFNWLFGLMKMECCREILFDKFRKNFFFFCVLSEVFDLLEVGDCKSLLVGMM